MDTKQKISDYSYSLFFGGFYLIAIYKSILFPERVRLENLTILQTVSIVTLNWFLCSILIMHFWLTEYFFRKGIIEKQYNFLPLEYFRKNLKSILVVMVFPLLQTLMLLVSIVLLFPGKIILRFMFFGIGDVTVWNGLFIALLIFSLMKLFSLMNAKILKVYTGEIDMFDWRFDQKFHPEQTISTRMVLGKYTNDYIMIFVICVFGFGGILSLSEKNVDPIAYCLIVFCFSFAYNCYYLYQKQGYIWWRYCFIGSLPFCFIFPASLPKKNKT